MKKIILISGCSSGLGRRVAEILEGKGHKVYAGIRNSKKRQDLNVKWKDTHPNISAIELDITDDKSCTFVVNKIINKEKRLDVLVNCAGYGLVGPATSFTSSDFIKILDTNVIGAFRLIKIVLPHMLKRSEGKIINITSLCGTLAVPNSSLYCSSKFALEALGLSIRYEVAKNNIWITNLAPSVMKNESQSGDKKMLSKPLRERFFLFKLLVPMVDYDAVATRVDWIVNSTRPPSRVSIGADAKIFSFLQRFLPNDFFDFLVRCIFRR